MKVDVTVDCPVHDSFRVQQIAALFDVPLAARSRAQFAVELPSLDEDWQIGAILGPSGSGKTTIARRAYPDYLYDPATGPWPADRAVVDGFPKDLSIRDITQTLTAVGFSSPPSWIKPYTVLSNGEKFRCELARALLIEQPVVVFDEFTSVVDRVVARIGSAAIAKAIRKGKVKRRFVAVSCHYDIAEWLECDWVLDMATSTLARGRLRRPQITLEVVQCDRAAWRLFAKHHYLSSTLHLSSQCYMALWDGEPVAFCAIQANFGHKNCWRISRVVVLPDYQGLGVGCALAETVAQMWVAKGIRVTMATAHPAIIRRCDHSSLWRTIHVNRYGNRHHGGADKAKTGHLKPPAVSAMRPVVSFEFVGRRA